MKLTSLDKSLRVIDLLSKNPGGLSLFELSAMLDFPKSTVHHILDTLLPHDYILKDSETRKYSLGFKFLEIGKGILDNMDIRRIAHKYLHELHDKCREAVHLAILRNGKVIYIDKVDTPGGLSPSREIMSIYREKSLKAYGKNTITDPDLLLEELKRVRDQGYAVDDEEYYEGIRCVAAPVRAGGEIVAALSITGSIFTMTREKINGELKELVMRKAEEISSQMRW